MRRNNLRRRRPIIETRPCVWTERLAGQELTSRLLARRELALTGRGFVEKSKAVPSCDVCRVEHRSSLGVSEVARHLGEHGQQSSVRHADPHPDHAIDRFRRRLRAGDLLQLAEHDRRDLLRSESFAFVEIVHLDLPLLTRESRAERGLPRCSLCLPCPR